VNDAVQDSGDGAEIGGFAAKDTVIGGFVRVAREVDTRSAENDGGREQDSGAEQVAEDEFDAAVSPWLGLERMGSRGRLGCGHQIFPQNPL
jgi:hypothetical protein